MDKQADPMGVFSDTRPSVPDWTGYQVPGARDAVGQSGNKAVGQ